MELTRRTFVGTLPLTAVAGAGCVGGGDDGSDATPDTTPDSSDGDSPDGTDTEDDGKRPPSESSYGLRVEPISTETLLERFDVATLGSQPSPVRDAIQEAVSDRYETDAVGATLTAFVAAHEFVRVDEAYYTLEAKLPQEVLTLRPVERDDIDDAELVGGRRLRESEVILDAVADATDDGETKRATFPNLLSELVAEYEYVTPDQARDEDRSVYEWELETADNGGPPYWVEATAVDEETVFGDRVVAFESLSPAAQAEIESARDEGHASFDESPAVLDEPSFQYLRIDGTVYQVAVSVGN